MCKCGVSVYVCVSTRQYMWGGGVCWCGCGYLCTVRVYAYVSVECSRCECVCVRICKCGGGVGVDGEGTDVCVLVCVDMEWVCMCECERGRTDLLTRFIRMCVPVSVGVCVREGAKDLCMFVKDLYLYVKDLCMYVKECVLICSLVSFKWVFMCLWTYACAREQRKGIYHKYVNVGSTGVGVHIWGGYWCLFAKEFLLQKTPVAPACQCLL